MDIFALVRENLRRIRELKGLSQEVVAERADMTQPNYSRLENGPSKPTLSTLVRVSDAMGCTIQELIAIEGPTANTQPARSREKVQDRRSPQPDLSEIPVKYAVKANEKGPSKRKRP